MNYQFYYQMVYKRCREFWYNYCGGIEATPGTNGFGITKHSTDLLHTLIDKKKLQHTDITSWDFSTLYITLPHSYLKRCSQSLVYNVFQKNRWKKLIATFRNSFFSDCMKDSQHGFDYDEFMDYLKD